jgi:hypothetical protein
MSLHHAPLGTYLYVFNEQSASSKAVDNLLRVGPGIVLMIAIYTLSVPRILETFVTRSVVILSVTLVQSFPFFYGFSFSLFWCEQIVCVFCI